MNIVVLSASPHKNGTTAVLVDSFIKGAKEAGHEIIRFNAAFMNIHPCIGCEKCHANGGKCVFQDDMLKIGEALKKSDCVVLVTPIYYYEICSQLKIVIDRFYAIESEIRRNQKSVFITAMADDKTETVAIANALYTAISDWMGWTSRGIVNAFSCFTANDLDGKDYVEKVYELGKRI